MVKGRTAEGASCRENFPQIGGNILRGKVQEKKRGVQLSRQLGEKKKKKKAGEQQ